MTLSPNVAFIVTAKHASCKIIHILLTAFLGLHYLKQMITKGVVLFSSILFTQYLLSVTGTYW